MKLAADTCKLLTLHKLVNEAIEVANQLLTRSAGILNYRTEYIIPKPLVVQTIKLLKSPLPVS